MSMSAQPKCEQCVQRGLVCKKAKGSRCGPCTSSHMMCTLGKFSFILVLVSY
jgi:hypothetical protein